MKRGNPELETIAHEINARLSTMDQAREKALQLGREVIRHSSRAIRAVHRQEYDRARETLLAARSLLDEARRLVKGEEELDGAGLLHSSQKEFAEASITLCLLSGDSLPTPSSLGVTCAAYLNGIGEAVGEIRRYLLDAIRQGEPARGEEFLQAMEDIYDVLITMDFPDALTGGLRRTTDMARGVLEKTRGDLTLTTAQRSLEKKLGSLAPKPEQAL